jgi:hypothetical protein
MECLAARRRALRFGAKSTRGCVFYVKYDETTIVALTRERRVAKEPREACNMHSTRPGEPSFYRRSVQAERPRRWPLSW